jgi:Flp pilus assembly protein TadD
MFAPKHLGLTLLLSSILAACSSAPKKPVATPDAANVTIAPTEANELDLEKMAKERAAQGQTKTKDESKEKNAAAVDTSQEPTMAGITDELKKQAAPVQESYKKAIVLMKAQQLDEAFALFDDIQTKAPMFAGPVLNQALIRIQQLNYKEADLLLKKAVGINDKNPFVYNLQGFVARQQGQFANARAAYEKAIATTPKYAKAHFNLGVLADLYLQDLPLALKHYEAYQALQASPDSTVTKWIVDLQKRTGVYKAPAKPAKVEEITVEETPAPVAEPTPTTPTGEAAINPAPTTTTTPDSSVADKTTSTPETTSSDKPTAETVSAEAPKTSTDTKNVKEKTKKSSKSKKQSKNVTSGTATPVAEAVKSATAESAPTSTSEQTPTTAAGVQP